MKPSSILSTCMVAFAATTAAVPTDADVSSPALFNATLFDAPAHDPGQRTPIWCERLNQHGWGWFYRIYIRDVDPDTWGDTSGGLCKGLFDNLKGFQFLCPVTFKKCGKAEGAYKGEDDLFMWRFQASLACNPGCVQAAVWGATKWKYGEINMSGCK